MSYLDPELVKAAARDRARSERGGSDSSSRSATSAPVLLKIIVIGASNSGKTSLMKRYCFNDFTGQRRPTLGADFMTKSEELRGTPLLLQIWDTAGQERFHVGALGAGFYRGASAALIVYDVTSPASVKQVAMWRDELLERLDEESRQQFPIVVLANKVDLVKEGSSSPVDRAEVAAWCASLGMGHLETSAKDGVGVQPAMTCVAMLALEEKLKQQALQQARGRDAADPRTIRLSATSPPHRGQGCCA